MHWKYGMKSLPYLTFLKKFGSIWDPFRNFWSEFWTNFELCGRFKVYFRSFKVYLGYSVRFVSIRENAASIQKCGL